MQMKGKQNIRNISLKVKKKHKRNIDGSSQNFWTEQNHLPVPQN